MIPDDHFAQPPAASIIYLEFHWSCGAKDWYLFEDDQKDHLEGTTGFAHQLKPKLDDGAWAAIGYWVDECLQQHHLGCINSDPIYLPGLELI